LYKELLILYTNREMAAAAPAAPAAAVLDFLPIGIDLALDGTQASHLRFDAAFTNALGNQANIFPLNDNRNPYILPAVIAAGGYANPQSLLKYHVDSTQLRGTTVIHRGLIQINYQPHTAANPNFIVLGGNTFYIKGPSINGAWGCLTPVSTNSNPAVPAEYMLKLIYLNDDNEYKSVMKEFIVNSIIDQKYHNHPLCQFTNSIYAVAGDINLTLPPPNPGQPQIVYPHVLYCIQEKLSQTFQERILPIVNVLTINTEMKNLIYQIAAKLQILWGENQFNHSDLKSNNVMMDATGNYRLIDFGFSRMDPFLNGNEIVADPMGLTTRASESRDFTQLLWSVWHSSKGSQVPNLSPVYNLFDRCLHNIAGLFRLNPNPPNDWLAPPNGVDLRDINTRQAPGQIIADVNSQLAIDNYDSFFRFGNQFNNPNATPTAVKNYLEQPPPQGFGQYPGETYGIAACAPELPELVFESIDDEVDFGSSDEDSNNNDNADNEQSEANSPSKRQKIAIPPAPPAVAAGAPRRGGGRIKGLILPYLYTSMTGGKRKIKKRKTRNTKSKQKSKKTKRSRR
jgi:hypothetical protein